MNGISCTPADVRASFFDDRSEPCVMEGGDEVPFSKENIRYTLALMLIGFVAMITIVGSTYLVQHDKQTANLWMVGGGIITGLIGFARAEFRAKESATERRAIRIKVDKTHQKVDEIERKTNGNLTHAVQEVGEQVRRAAMEPAPGQEGMPRNPAELQALIRTFVESRDKSCERIAKEAGREAATAVTRETVRLVVEELRSQGALILPAGGKMERIPGEIREDTGGGI